jgi:hypothetical protein
MYGVTLMATWMVAYDLVRSSSYPLHYFVVFTLKIHQRGGTWFYFPSMVPGMDSISPASCAINSVGQWTWSIADRTSHSCWLIIVIYHTCQIWNGSKYHIFCIFKFSAFRIFQSTSRFFQFAQYDIVLLAGIPTIFSGVLVDYSHYHGYTRCYPMFISGWNTEIPVKNAWII